MLSIEFDPFKGISIRKVSLPGDIDYLKEILFNHHSPSSAAESDEKAIVNIFESRLMDPNMSFYLIFHRKKALFVAEIMMPDLNPHVYYPRKPNDFVLRIHHNIGPTEKSYALRALKAMVERLFAVYHIARIIAPVRPDKPQDPLLTILKKARFSLLQDQTDAEPDLLYAREQVPAYTN